jgi:hypothetical protein
MDNFDLKKYLVENKVTTNSKMLNEDIATDQAVSKLESMGFDEGLLAYIVQDGKVLVVNKQDRMMFDHYADYLYDLVDANGGIVSVSKYQGTVPSTGGIKANLKAEITFKNGEKLIIAQDTTSESPEYDDDGNLVGDTASGDVMNVAKFGDKFFSMLNKLDLIPVEKWIESKNIPTNKVKAAINAETFTEFENILRAEFPSLYKFETGDDQVETVYVYDLGDGTVAMVDDYVDGFSLHSKAVFEKFKEVLKQASDKTEA